MEEFLTQKPYRQQPHKKEYMAELEPKGAEFGQLDVIYTGSTFHDALRALSIFP